MGFNELYKRTPETGKRDSWQVRLYFLRDNDGIETMELPTKEACPDEPLPNSADWDPARQEQAKKYARVQRRLLALELLLSGLLVLIFLLTGLSIWLRDALISAGLQSPWLLVPVYLAIVGLVYAFLFLPLNRYSSYTLPHRYGLSTQTSRSWWADQLKSLTLGAVIGLPVAQVIYWLLRVQPQTWWLWASLFLVLFSVILGSLAPVLILPLFYKLIPLKDEDLLARIQRLAQRARTTVVGVYTIDLSRRTTAANAMVMGLGRTKRIALGDTLYGEFSHDEIETIIAHELGHQVHRDLELGIVIQSAFILVGMGLAHLFLQWGVDAFGFFGPGDIAALPLLILALALFGLVTMPLSNGYSRWRERLADRYAVQVTGNPQAFSDAMLRLADQNLAEADPPRWIVWLLYSHPPIKERVMGGE
jgi:STE24 endopeptidase